jgi:hypothetical protein
MRRLPALLFIVAGCAANPEPVSDDPRDAPVTAPPAGSSPPAPPPTTPTPAPQTTTPPPTTNSVPTKTLKILTYNVAGLPQGISGSSPAENTGKISPKLNPFELVLVQEDFSYHQQLISQATHPFKTPPMNAVSAADLGDGLNALSRYAFSGLARTKWTKCNGIFDQKNDCLTSKGFSFMTLDLGDGMLVDVYDVHFDAGRSDGDANARDAQVKQLADAITAKSAGHAVIVAGDTNMKASDETTLQALLTAGPLECSCRTMKCAETDRIDRVLLRSSTSLKLSAKSWIVDPSFVDAAGKPLSDHEPVSVEVSLTKL